MKKTIIAIIVLIISVAVFVFFKVFLSPCENNESGWYCRVEHCSFWGNSPECLDLSKQYEKKIENYEEKCVEEGSRWGWCTNRLYFPENYKDLDFYNLGFVIGEGGGGYSDLYCDMALDDEGKDCTSSEECQGRCVINEELLVKEIIPQEEPENEKVEQYNSEELNNDFVWFNNNYAPFGYGDEFTCEGTCIGYCSQYPLTNCDNWFEVLDDKTVIQHYSYSFIEEK
jgi:hypothetical protein